jgi:predicted NodU family carbamoyl transferase
MLTRATVRREFREHLRGAIDATGGTHAHVLDASDPSLLHELLLMHWRRTGVPGLINTPLQSLAEPTACSPRDAIRATYSSAVDAIVIHRFLVMKDHWLMRAEDA